MTNIAIIGCGASGMMAALAATDNNAKVTIFEYRDEAALKILSTGNGRCNISNRKIDENAYYCDDRALVKAFLKKFSPDDTLAYFEKLGLMFDYKEDLVYPASFQASTVRNLLLNELKRRNVTVRTGHIVDKITAARNGFIISSEKRQEVFDKVILACGSYAGIKKNKRLPGDIDGYSLAYHLGHTIKPVKPSLCGINCVEEYIKKAAGTRIFGKISAFRSDGVKASDSGEIQITDYGISGIPVFNISHIVSAADSTVNLVLDLYPDKKEVEIKDFAFKRAKNYIGRTVNEYCLGMLNSGIYDMFLAIFKISGETKINEDNIEILAERISSLKNISLSSKGSRSFENAQCCLGGIPLDEIDENCMSRKNKGLYICGEMLDIDGICGGYNLQWAWTSGHIAGNGASINA